VRPRNAAAARSVDERGPHRRRASARGGFRTSDSVGHGRRCAFGAGRHLPSFGDLLAVTTAVLRWIVVANAVGVMFWAYPCIHAHWTATCRSSAVLTDERGAWEMRESSRASRCLRRQPRRCPRILSVDDCARRQPGLDNGSQVVVDAGRRPTRGLCADRQVWTGNCRCFPAHCISQCDTVMETRFAQLGFSWATLEVMGHERASEARRWGPHTAIWQRAPYRQY